MSRLRRFRNHKERNALCPFSSASNSTSFFKTTEISRCRSASRRKQVKARPNDGTPSILQLQDRPHHAPHTGASHGQRRIARNARYRFGSPPRFPIPNRTGQRAFPRCIHGRKNAQASHPYHCRRQSDARTFALRLIQGAHYFSTH